MILLCPRSLARRPPVGSIANRVDLELTISACCLPDFAPARPLWPAAENRHSYSGKNDVGCCRKAAGRAAYCPITTSTPVKTRSPGAQGGKHMNRQVQRTLGYPRAGSTRRNFILTATKEPWKQMSRISGKNLGNGVHRATGCLPYSGSRLATSPTSGG